MSLKKLLETLRNFGFKQTDAEIYILLVRTGPHTAKDLKTNSKMPKWQIYESLRTLQKKGVVNAILQRPALFTALPLDKVVDLIAKSKIEEARLERANSDQAVVLWEKMMKENSDPEAHRIEVGNKEVKNK